MTTQSSTNAPTAPVLGDVLDFMRLLWRIDHLLQIRSKRMESSLGITAPQRLVLRIIGRFPGLPPGELARILQLHPSTVTGIVQRLEARRLVARRKDPRDARRALLALTARGRDLDVQTPGTVESAISAALAQTSHPQLQASRELLGAIANSLEESPGQGYR